MVSSRLRYKTDLLSRIEVFMREDEEQLISIIVPVYNTEYYLGDCVASLCAQSYEKIEIILVDDGSTDRSGRLCDFYADKDPRIKVIHKENGGLSSARNTGIEAASGSYIGFVDSDDFVHKDMYRHLLQLLGGYGMDIAVCRFAYVSERADQFLETVKGIILGVYTGEEPLWNLLSADERINSGIMCDKLFATELFADIRFPMGKYHEDEYVIHKLFDQAVGVVYSSFPYYYYRRRDGSITNAYSLHNLDMLQAYENRADYYRQRNYKDLYQASVLRYLHLLTYHYFQLLKRYPRESKMRTDIVKRVKDVLEREEIRLPKERYREYRMFIRCPILYKILQKLCIYENL